MGCAGHSHGLAAEGQTAGRRTKCGQRPGSAQSDHARAAAGTVCDSDRAGAPTGRRRCEGNEDRAARPTERKVGAVVGLGKVSARHDAINGHEGDTGITLVHVVHSNGRAGKAHGLRAKGHAGLRHGNDLIGADAGARKSNRVRASGGAIGDRQGARRRAGCCRCKVDGEVARAPWCDLSTAGEKEETGSD